MMRGKLAQSVITSFLGIVWCINGLFCKILNLVPRHQEIVARVLGEGYASILTKAIGCGELAIVIWIATRIKARACAVFQMLIVGAMNVIEFIMVPDLLLFGRMNIVFASFLIILIYINEFTLGVVKSHATTNSR